MCCKIHYLIHGDTLLLSQLSGFLVLYKEKTMYSHGKWYLLFISSFDCLRLVQKLTIRPILFAIKPKLICWPGSLRFWGFFSFFFCTNLVIMIVIAIMRINLCHPPSNSLNHCRMQARRFQWSKAERLERGNLCSHNERQVPEAQSDFLLLTLQHELWTFWVKW